MRRWKTLKSRKEWRAERGALDAREKQEKKDAATARARARGRCEVTLGIARCTRADVDGHHVIKRSAGGRFLGADYILRVCRLCHALFDQHPTQRTLIGGVWVPGQLKAVALGGGQFRCWLETTTKRAQATRPLAHIPFVVEHAAVPRAKRPSASEAPGGH